MLEKIKTILAQYVDADMNEVTEETRLAEDLGLTSYSLMSMMGEFEETFQITVDEAELTDIFTVGDVMKYIEKKSGKKK